EAALPPAIALELFGTGHTLVLEPRHEVVPEPVAADTPGDEEDVSVGAREHTETGLLLLASVTATHMPFEVPVLDRVLQAQRDALLHRDVDELAGAVVCHECCHGRDGREEAPCSIRLPPGGDHGRAVLVAAQPQHPSERHAGGV